MRFPATEWFISRKSLRQIFANFSITNTFVSLTFSTLVPHSDVRVYLSSELIVFVVYSFSENESDGMVCGRVACLVAFFQTPIY